MKFTAILIKDCKEFLSNIFSNTFMFLIFPLILGLLYGILFENMINPKITFHDTEVYMVNEDNGTYGKALNSLFENDHMSFVNLENSTSQELDDRLNKNKKSLGIVIPKNFSSSIEEKKEISIKIINKGPKSLEKDLILNLLNDFIENTNLHIKSLAIMKENIKDEIKLEEEIQTFMKVNAELSRTSFTSIKDVKSPEKLSSKASMLTSSFTAISLFIALTLASNFLKGRESSVVNRLCSINLSKNTLFFGKFASCFLLSFILITIYTLISYKIILRIPISLSKLFMVIALHSLFLGSLEGLIIGLFRKDRTLKNIIFPIVFLFMFFGGSFFPLESFKNASVLSKFTPNYNLQKIYEGILLNKSFGELFPIALSLIVISAIFIIIGNLKFSLREE